METKPELIMEVPLSCLQILLLVMFSEPHNKDELLYHGLYIIIIMPRDFAVLLCITNAVSNRT